ncbi:hypothetical protein N9M66_00360 [Litoreibacter sp.]|nr:hypothetical protein [Litoreibacter sp.]
MTLTDFNAPLRILSLICENLKGQTMATFSVELSGADVSFFQQELSAKNVDYTPTRLVSSTGVENVQLFIDCATVVVPSIAAIVAACISRGGTVVVVVDGKRVEVEDAETFTKAIEQEKGQ